MAFHVQRSALELTELSRARLKRLAGPSNHPALKKLKVSPKRPTPKEVQMASHHPLRPEFVPPSEREVHTYYFGLPGPPKLVARLGSRVFDNLNPSNNYRDDKLKRVTTIGQHSLRQHVDHVTGSSTVTLREEILVSIRRLKWASLDFVRIGGDGEDLKPTILIVVNPDSTSIIDAQHTLEEIWEACNKRDIHDVEIEIMEGISTGSLDVTPCLPSTPYLQIPLCGTSLGPVNKDSAGTLGCYVTIDGENAGTYLLTNDHVVFPEINDRPRNFREVFKASDHPGFTLAVESPAQKDHDELEKHLRKLLLANIDKFRKLERESECANRQERPPLGPFDVAALASFPDKIEKLNATLTQISTFNRVIGQVSFSSGVRIDQTTKSRLDWALISIDSDRLGPGQSIRNALPQCTFSSGHVSSMNYNLRQGEQTDWTLDEDASLRLTALHSWAYIDSALNLGQEAALRVLKCGRTTGWTSGRINEIVGSCTRRGDDLITTEVTAVNLITNTPFGRKGDSGSIVMDVRGGVLGQYHSCTEPNATGAVTSRLSAIDCVIEDIMAVTGATRVDFHLEP